MLSDCHKYYCFSIVTLTRVFNDRRLSSVPESPGEKLYRIFKDLLEDLGEDLRKDPQQRSLKILKDPNFSCQDPQKSLQRSSRIFKDLQRSCKDLQGSLKIFEDLCKIFKDP